jgi:hypothetical protein
MSTNELTELTNDIRKNGLLVPILTYQGEIIDGRHRYLACREAGVEPRFEEWKQGDKSIIGTILSLNVVRRHLSSSQRAALAVDALPFFEAEAAERQKATQAVPGEKVGSKVTQKVESPSNRNETTAIAQAAQAAGTNRQYVYLAKKMKQEEPERFEQVKQGKETLSVIPKPKVEEQQKEKTPVEISVGEILDEETDDDEISDEDTPDIIQELVAQTRALTIPEISKAISYVLEQIERGIEEVNMYQLVKRTERQLQLLKSAISKQDRKTARSVRSTRSSIAHVN